MATIFKNRITSYLDQKELVETIEKELENVKTKMDEEKKKIKAEYKNANVLRANKADKFIEYYEKANNLENKLDKNLVLLEQYRSSMVVVFQLLNIKNVTFYYKNKKHKATYNHNNNTFKDETV